ncbi:hypothetical protein F4861DRAFT_170325 [Xylaria intraflava]|nr:hypothetical protein F4861DRAFT_170325 [Xylaria intraflava]
MSEDVSRFLSQVKELGERRVEDEEARSRELEEKILQDRKERQARRRGKRLSFFLFLDHLCRVVFFPLFSGLFLLWVGTLSVYYLPLFFFYCSPFLSVSTMQCCAAYILIFTYPGRR